MPKPLFNDNTAADLWDQFRAIHGPRPGGRGAQERWEKRWLRFLKDAGYET